MSSVQIQNHALLAADQIKHLAAALMAHTDGPEGETMAALIGEKAESLAQVLSKLSARK